MLYALSLLLSPPALAQPAEGFDAPLVELLSVGEILGDGKTPVTFHLLILDPSGQPYEGLELKFGVDRRQLENVENLGNGLYRATWTPPMSGRTRIIAIDVRAKTLEKKRLSNAWEVPMRPPTRHDLTLASTPDSLIAGDEAMSIAATLSSGSIESRDHGALRLRSAVGEVGEVTGGTGGVYTASVGIPETRTPRCVQVTAVDARAPSENYGALAVRHATRETVRVVGEPDSQLMVRIGDRERGPFQADAAGAASVELDVQPGTTELVVTSLVDGQRVEKTQPMTVTPTSRVQLFPLPDTLAADPGVSVPVRAFVASPGCLPDAAADLTLQVTTGSIGEPHHEGYGVYVADYTPAERAGPLTITASLADGGWDQSDKASTELGVASTEPVETLAVTAETRRILPNGLTAVGLTISPRDARGLPVRELPVTLVVTRGDGTVPATATTDASGVAEVFYTAGREPGLISVLVVGGGHTATVDLLQLPADLAPDLALP